MLRNKGTFLCRVDNVAEQHQGRGIEAGRAAYFPDDLDVFVDEAVPVLQPQGLYRRTMRCGCCGTIGAAPSRLIGPAIACHPTRPNIMFDRMIHVLSPLAKRDHALAEV
jgi:hypothetical protein